MLLRPLLLAAPRRAACPTLRHLPSQPSSSCPPPPLPPSPPVLYPTASRFCRFYSAAAPSALKRERISLPCRSSGFITVDVFQPLVHAAASPPVLIYLPSGSLKADQSGFEEDHLLPTLSSSSGSLIARINYRLSSEHRFPAPVHDVLTGYDWVLENLLQQDLHNSSKQPQIARLGVCGELFGGTLATMLALTECRLGGSRIGAAAVNNPITDWVFPDSLTPIDQSKTPESIVADETSFPAEKDFMSWWEQEDEKEGTPKEEAPKSKSRKRSKKKPESSWEKYGDNEIISTSMLLRQRDEMFKRPEDYFDRFASPCCFFRSPSGQLIYPQDDDVLASMSPEDGSHSTVDVETQLAIEHYDSQIETRPIVAPELPTLAKCRSYARIYPPSSSSLSLPYLHVTSGSQSPLLDQASELAKFMKRSIARQALRSRTSRVMWQDPAEKAKYEDFAQQRVRLDIRDGLGLWTAPSCDTNSTSRVENAGAWLKEILKSANTP